MILRFFQSRAGWTDCRALPSLSRYSLLIKRIRRQYVKVYGYLFETRFRGSLKETEALIGEGAGRAYLI